MIILKIKNEKYRPNNYININNYTRNFIELPRRL